ncbi:hypothetical protein [Streptomyces virginiae]
MDVVDLAGLREGVGPVTGTARRHAWKTFRRAGQGRALVGFSSWVPVMSRTSSSPFAWTTRPMLLQKMAPGARLARL